MKNLLSCLVAVIAAVAGIYTEEPPMTLEEIVKCIDSDRPFDISPRYLVFSPTGELKKSVEQYMKEMTPEKILEVESSLRSAKSGYVAIALGSMLNGLRSTQASDAIEKYREYLRSSAGTLWEDFPKREDVLRYLPAQSKRE